MTGSVLINPVTWDEMIDADGNIALCTEPYCIVQDVMTACRTFKGDCFYDLDYGIDYFNLMNGSNKSAQILKLRIEQQAMTVQGVDSAIVTSMFLNQNRSLDVNLLINGSINVQL